MKKKAVGALIQRTVLRALAVTLLYSGSVQAGLLELFEANVDSAGELQPTVDAFRAALGERNANDPVNGDPGGRREIDFENVPDHVADPNSLPGDFFNAAAPGFAAGLEFRGVLPGTGFEVSASAASSEPIEFGFPAGFTPFSGERLFTPTGETIFDILFFDPARPEVPALTRGLGIVFTDVEDDRATLSFFDRFDNLLFEDTIASGANASLSFFGAIFTDFEIARVRVNAGIVGVDSIVMDDFIFGEPVAAVSLPAPLALLSLGLLGLMRRAKN